jgi:biotin carboxylase
MLRALEEYRIEGIATLVPFHRALLASDEWARGETAANLLDDPAWLAATAPAK